MFGYFLLAVGGTSVAGNLLFLGTINDFSRFTWYDINGNPNVFEIEQSGLFYFAMIKIISGILLLKQSTMTYNTMRPILKEYSDAETGRTRGVVMIERKSKKTQALRKHIGQVTAAVILMTALACAYGSEWFDDEASRFVDEFYLVNNQANAVNSTTLNTTSLFTGFEKIHHEEQSETEEEFIPDVDPVDFE